MKLREIAVVLGLLAAMTACTTSAIATSPAPPPGLVWINLDSDTQTACTAWGDRLYRSTIGTAWSIAVVPDSQTDSPCGFARRSVEYGPGATP